ncbi:hypothetical protein [Geobacter sp. SVR]|uniref:hypothetical protein n=1 Tax=Geobacter sp. SVR TaxID=2495594 RepID=UPI00143F0384|nr:hypothetical protein [Geobacter sp. SVR]BCS54761.1 hypothetical protein GSVR_30690 [Geobacter sp. SVR]GCF86431.1 hypothetical protein GSbR_30310 [Geobacter sp. SVR]
MTFDANRTGTGTAEWAEVTENICRGCRNNCLYCYAAHNANRFNQRARAEWGREELTKRAAMTSYPAREGVVMFPSSHDITPFNVEHYCRVAELILKKGNKLLIVSKPSRDCIRRVMDALEKWQEQIMFRFTIGATTPALISFWEPGAPSGLQRLGALSDAAHRGFSTSVSIEPMLGGVEETLRVVDAVRVYDPETIWIGKMNKIRSRVDLEHRWAVLEVERLQSDTEIMRLYQLLDGQPDIRWKDSIKEVVAKHLEVPEI